MKDSASCRGGEIFELNSVNSLLNNKLKKMKVIFIKELNNFLRPLSFLLLVLCGTTEIPYTAFVAQLPSLTYELNLNAGDSIVGTCSWTV